MTQPLPPLVILADTNNRGYYVPSVDARERAIKERLAYSLTLDLESFKLEIERLIEELEGK